MKFLVTGASGMTGSRLAECLARRHGKDSVIALTSPFWTPEQNRRRSRLSRLGIRQIPANLLDPAALKGLPEVDVIFHLAAELGVDLQDGKEGAPIRVNDQGTANLIESVGPQLKGKLFVYTSSVAVADRAEFKPERITENSPCAPRTLYGQTKLCGERIVAGMSSALGFRYCIFRLATIYGPDWRERHIFDHFTQWVKAGSLPARIDWPGKISLVYVDDVVDVLMAAVDRRELENDLFFISNPEDLTVGTMVKIMSEALKKSPRLLPIPRAIVQCLAWAAFQNQFWRQMPGFVAIFVWRLSLIISNGFYCDSSKLNRVYPKKYVDAREGIQRAYQSDPQSRETEYANHAH